MKNICVVTGTRAEYGLLRNTMKGIKASSKLDLQVIAAAMHLSPEFGETYKEIERDGFEINWKVEMLLSSDSQTATSKSIGLGTIEFSTAFEKLKPDLILILGDRFEILSAAIAAMTQNIPIAHYHGGELTEGLIDEAIRHSITKMSHLHFCSTQRYRQRIIQLGESPNRAFYVGAPGIENIVGLTPLSLKELEDSIEFNLTSKFLLVTYHPVTLQEDSPHDLMSELFQALNSFKDHKILITLPNSDPSGRQLISLIKEFENQNSDRVKVVTSLGQLRYLSAVKLASCVVGNSSSGLIEVPYLNTPTVNIGIRQQGRIGSNSVVNCSHDQESIKKAIQKSLTQEFLEICNNSEKNYGKGDVSQKVVSILESCDLNSIIIKKFYDLDFKAL